MFIARNIVAVSEAQLVASGAYCCAMSLLPVSYSMMVAFGDATVHAITFFWVMMACVMASLMFVMYTSRKFSRLTEEVGEHATTMSILTLLVPVVLVFSAGIAVSDLLVSLDVRPNASLCALMLFPIGRSLAMAINKRLFPGPAAKLVEVRAKARRVPTERVAVLVDGVLAISATFIVLDIQPQRNAQVPWDDMWDEMKEKIYTYPVAVALVVVVWLHSNKLLCCCKEELRVSSTYALLSQALATVLMPLATTVLAAKPSSSALRFMAIVLTLSGLWGLAAYALLVRNGDAAVPFERQRRPWMCAQLLTMPCVVWLASAFESAADPARTPAGFIVFCVLGPVVMRGCTVMERRAVAAAKRGGVAAS